MKIIKISTVTIALIILIGIITAGIAVCNSDLGCRSELKRPVLLTAKSPKYLVNIKLTETKENNHYGTKYFGTMYFANLTNKDINYILGDDDVLATNNKDKYKIYIQNGTDIYPLNYDSIASVFWGAPKDSINISPIVVWHIPEDFDWSKSEIIVSDSLFADVAQVFEPENLSTPKTQTSRQH
jgi:hypothetical protein